MAELPENNSATYTSQDQRWYSQTKINISHLALIFHSCLSNVWVLKTARARPSTNWHHCFCSWRRATTNYEDALGFWRFCVRFPMSHCGLKSDQWNSLWVRVCGIIMVVAIGPVTTSSLVLSNPFFYSGKDFPVSTHFFLSFFNSSIPLPMRISETSSMFELGQSHMISPHPNYSPSAVHFLNLLGALVST